jgi:trehalose 6-phosphate phosphatase
LCGERFAKPLAEHLDEAAETVRRAGRLLVFLDFDGTLAAVVDCPREAVIPDATREALAALARNPGVSVGVVSGRALDDLEVRVGVDGLIYAGNHGLEIHGPSFRFTEPRAMAARPVLREVREALAQKIRPVQGAWIEDKGLTLSLHFRHAERAALPVLNAAVQEAVAGINDVRSRLGKEVFEVRPNVNWHKEAAMRWIARTLNWTGAAMVYAGDDATDEEAFALLPEAITVKVGEPAGTWARYCVPGTEEVRGMLVWLRHATK